MKPALEEAMRHRVYPITRRISIGQFATDARVQYLLAQGYTHILNVGEAQSTVTGPTHGFRDVVDVDVADLTLIPDEIAIRCIDALHGMLRDDSSRVFLHCIACQNRSPTILWLYLVACGVDESSARTLIADRCPDAVPGHGALVNDVLVERVRSYGREHYLPVESAIVEPAY